MSTTASIAKARPSSIPAWRPRGAVVDTCVGATTGPPCAATATGATSAAAGTVSTPSTAQPSGVSVPHSTTRRRETTTPAVLPCSSTPAKASRASGDPSAYTLMEPEKSPT